MKTSFFLPVVACASFAFPFQLALASPPAEPFVPDEHTLLLAHFDQSPHAGHALGLAAAGGQGKITPDGRFSGALELGERMTLAFAGQGNFPGDEGTVEFWIKPEWSGDDGLTRTVFGASGGARNYLNINKLSTGKFGAGLCGAPGLGEEFTYCRADHGIDGWKAGEWHHVAVCWSDGTLSLWLDGTLVESRQGALAPRSAPESIRLGGSAFVLDEFCISRVSRYRPDESGKAAARVAGRPVEPRVDMAQRWEFNEPAGVYRCESLPAPSVGAGFVLLPKNYLDEADPAKFPDAEGARNIELFASPGEIEPASFLIVATGSPLREVTVSATDLKGPGGVLLPADRVTIRRVIRAPMRKIYTAARHDTEIANRFLPRWKPLDIADGELREVWVQFDMPADAAPGLYEGAVTVRHAGGQGQIAVSLEVLPIRLIEHPDKKLASYYRMRSLALDPDRIDRELRDMYDHGLRALFPHIGLEYRREGEKWVPDLADLEDGIARLGKAGFTGGTVVVESGLPALARQMGHEDLGKTGDGASLDGDAQFQEAARLGMEALVEFQRSHPEYRLVATHLDEVFGGAGLLRQYIRLSRAARQVPEVPLYITFNTRDDRADAFRRELDPFVDLRCHHGYTFEMWLARGHTMDEYERELKESGDEAWFYHNARGPYWTPEWSRLVNGLYLWASPFTTHIPWTYQAYSDNPFDDTDGPETKGHDFGLSFPGNEDPADLIPTRCYEAMREGGDDLRYIATLEAAVAAAPPAKAAEAAAGRACLEKWRGLIRDWRATPPEGAAAPSEKGSGAVDADTGWIMGKGVTGTACESPLINDLASRHSGAGWQRMRREIADCILRLR